MTSQAYRAALFFVLSTILPVTLPVVAGEARYSTTGHKGHSVSRRGVENIYHSQRRLPNGVSIFNRHNHARHVPVHKGGKRKHARSATRNGQRGWKSRRGTKDKKHAKGSGNRRESAKRPRRGHKRHEKPRTVYAAGVAVPTPSEEYVYARDRGDEDCHYLIERGYDRTGRRVLVEWSLCFDDQGTAFVPDEGRRILARY